MYLSFLIICIVLWLFIIKEAQVEWIEAIMISEIRKMVVIRLRVLVRLSHGYGRERNIIFFKLTLVNYNI